MEKVCKHPLYPITKPREEGYLKVSEIHDLYYALYGNPHGVPVVVLHGGPGAGCSDRLTAFFNLERWNVIMFDQRGAMRSKPFGSLEENTSQHLVADIEKLREHLQIPSWVVFGGSWGATLAVLYGQAHPKRVLSFILRGICLCRKQDYLHLLSDMGKIFPEAFAEVLALIPKEEQHDLVSAYWRRLTDPDPAVQLEAARTFCAYDFLAATCTPDPKSVQEQLQNDSYVLSLAKHFFHYCKYDFFLRPNQLLDEMGAISHIPATIIHGRWDAICLPYMSHLLHEAWKASKLWMIPLGGHSAYDPPISQALVVATGAAVFDVSSTVGAGEGPKVMTL